MPTTAKGSEILSAMKKEYGPKHGEQVFYASRNKGTITGVDADKLSQACEKIDAALSRLGSRKA